MAEQPRTGSPIAVFDVCNTLYATNTTAGFVSFVHRCNHSRIGTLLVWLVRNPLSLLRYFLLLLSRLTHRDLPRNLLIRSLRGMPRELLEDLARRYVMEDLAHQKIEPVHKELADRKRDGFTICLASSSLDVVVAAIAKELEAHFVASRLGFKTGRCSGRLERDITGAKGKCLESLFPDGAGTWPFVCTDNASDAALVARAQEKMVVVSNGIVPASLKFEGARYVYID